MRTQQDYRLVTNGEVWKIEVKKRHWVLFWLPDYWATYSASVLLPSSGESVSYSPTFNSQEEAQGEIDRAIAADRRSSPVFHPVGGGQ
jgi:hypothetical protein